MALDYDNYDIVKGFDTIAPDYDRGNDAMTMGLHRHWRNSLCQKASDVTPPDGRLLDLATGTADVILGILKKRKDIEVVGVDPSEGMLEVGRAKIDDSKLMGDTPVELRVGDARELPFPDNSFDTVTISWGIRNVRPYTEGLAEMHRILKPGGWALVLESGTPVNPVMRLFYDGYKRLLPAIGGTITGYAKAYDYYKESVDRFDSDKAFTTQMEKQGFDDASYEAFMGGIIYLYAAQKKA